MDTAPLPWLGVALVVAIAAIAAGLLRWARMPGWSVVGGVCAGLLLGPSLLGRVSPDIYETLFVGGKDARQQLEILQQAQQHAATEPNATAPNPEMIASAQQELDDTRWEYQMPIRMSALLIAAAVMLGSALAPRGKPDPAQRSVSATSIGVWAALLPGGLCLFVLHVLLNIDFTPALLASSAVAIGPWALTEVDRAAADRAEFGGARLIVRAGMVATVIAFAAVLFAVFRQSLGDRTLIVFPLIALTLSWLLPEIRSDVLTTITHSMLIPALAAFAALKVDMYAHFAIWPLLTFLVLSGDGRWLGGFLGAKLLGGRKSLRTMRLVMGLMATGPTQLTIALMAGHGKLLDGSVIMAIVAGAVLIEVLAPTRRTVADHLTQTEQELDEIMHGDEDR